MATNESSKFYSEHPFQRFRNTIRGIRIPESPPSPSAWSAGTDTTEVLSRLDPGDFFPRTFASIANAGREFTASLNMYQHWIYAQPSRYDVMGPLLAAFRIINNNLKYLSQAMVEMDEAQWEQAGGKNAKLSFEAASKHLQSMIEPYAEAMTKLGLEMSTGLRHEDEGVIVAAVDVSDARGPLLWMSRHDAEAWTVDSNAISEQANEVWSREDNLDRGNNQQDCIVISSGVYAQKEARRDQWLRPPTTWWWGEMNSPHEQTSGRNFACSIAVLCIFPVAVLPGMAPTLSSLLSQTSLDDHNGILNAAASTLEKSKSDVTAQHARVVALLKLDRYEDALRALQEAGPTLQSRAKLEHAYALYKTGGLEEALKIAAAKDVKDRALLHLAAQTAYRAEDFEQAAAIYERLSSGISELESESDLRINKGACDSQLLWQGKGHLARKTRPDREDLAHFETMYNAACLYIARGQPKQAELMLNRAIDFCSKSDELTAEDKAAEILLMMVQQIYVLCRLGKTDEADKLCDNIKLQQDTDSVTKHIAQTNILTAAGHISNPFLAQRLISSSSSLPGSDRPFQFQESAFYRNSAVLDLKVGKSGGVSKTSLRTISKASSSFSEEAASAGVLNAAAVAKEQTGKQALKVLLPELEKRPADVGLLLTIIQLYVLTSNTQAATNLLESFFKRLEASTSPTDQDTRYAPGLVAVLVSLYAQQNRNAHTKAELAKAAAHWRHKSKTATSLSPSILRAAGTALLEQASPADLEAAREAFEALYATIPNEPVAKAGLVASSTADAPAPPDLTSTLPSIKDLTNGLDVAALESAGIPAAPSSAATTVTAPSRKRGAAPEAKSTTNDPTAPPRPNKKLRKTRVPKDYDPDKKPDPERWLPMRDRSYYRPKKGKKKAGGGGGHQGGMATQGGVDESAPAAAPSTVAGGGGGGGKNKKKKGKK